MKYLITITAIILATYPLHGANTRCYVPTPQEAVDGARVVLIGKVVSVTDPTGPAEGLQFKVVALERPLKVRFAVEHVYHGKKVREIELVTKTGGLEWGYEFKVGEKYIVYAHDGGAKEQALIVKGCGRSRPIRDATEDLKFLDGLSKAKTRKSR
jgi:hypothetical protein